MTAKLRIALCDACRHDGGWHYDDDGNATRPHLVEHQTRQEAARLTAMAYEQATKRAHDIITDAADTWHEFTANTIREQMDDAQIPTSVRSSAFTWAQNQGLIEVIPGRRVMSDDKGTRHELHVWRSVRRAPSYGGAA